MAHFSTSTTSTSTFLSVMANSTIRLNIPKAQTCTNIIRIMLNYKNMEFTRLFDFVFSLQFYECVCLIYHFSNCYFSLILSKVWIYWLQLRSQTDSFQQHQKCSRKEKLQNPSIFKNAHTSPGSIERPVKTLKLALVSSTWLTSTLAGVIHFHCLVNLNITKNNNLFHSKAQKQL